MICPRFPLSCRTKKRKNKKKCPNWAFIERKRQIRALFSCLHGGAAAILPPLKYIQKETGDIKNVKMLKNGLNSYKIHIGNIQEIYRKLKNELFPHTMDVETVALLTL